MPCTLQRLIAVALLSATPLSPLSAQSSGALPWQQPSHTQPSMARGQPQTYMPTPSESYPQAYAPSPSDSSLRELDDRKLNALAQNYYHISPKDPKAVAKFTRLQKRVRDFKAVLRQRAYGSDDLVKDIINLDQRISTAKKKAMAAQSKR